MTKFKVFILILIAFSICQQTLAQGIEGYVLAQDSQQPIEGAQVFVLSTDIKTVSNEKGYYKLPLKAGDYEIGVFFFERQSVTKNVSVEEVVELLSFSMPLLEKLLDEVTTKGRKENGSDIDRLNAVEGTSVYEGKKNELIRLEKINGNLATNNARQVFAKVPGLNIWESDAAGLQLGIGGRGLDPNRTSNFNTRQNGYDISADPLGYPESYYTPPMEALSKIEVVRGAASLQYGTQFGGMVNFVFKEGPKTKPFEFNTRNTVGSFGLFSSYNSVGGTTERLDYFAYYQRKQGNGWRDNESFVANSGFANATFHVNEKLDIAIEFTHMDYLAQQPGGLTERMLTEDPRQSVRDRNWFAIDWNIPALVIDYKVNSYTAFNLKTFGLFGSRKALGNIERVDRFDDPETNRNLLSDEYRNFGTELRAIQKYKVFDQLHALAYGVRYFKGFTTQEQGFGPAGKASDFYFLNPNNLEDLSYEYPSENIAMFAENVFNLSKHFSITPGIRWEYIVTGAEGYYRDIRYDVANNVIADTTNYEDKSSVRDFFLLGVGLSYKFENELEIYSNISQNYRAINFNDLRVSNNNLLIDPNITDETGYNFDIGFRGSLKNFLIFDWSAFYLLYNDRIGAIERNDPNPLIDSNNYRFRTNISDAYVAGFESYTELDIDEVLNLNQRNFNYSVFANIAVISAKYIDTENEFSKVNGKKVELVPGLNLKAGLNFEFKAFSSTYQFTHLSDQFSEATNTIATPSGIDGLIPSYSVMDLSFKYKYKFAQLEAGINNLTDNIYFTRRATGYPGPGILPSQGRNVYLTLGLKF
ncbi:MAG: Fe(3+) dicitrate transport protein [Marivirga sp.]|jgi:Fe(3+) dicitrate transport protein